MAAGEMEPSELGVDAGAEERHLAVVQNTEMLKFQAHLALWGRVLKMDSSEDISAASFAPFGKYYPGPSSWQSGVTHRTPPKQ
jgi:hypothetical protein